MAAKTREDWLEAGLEILAEHGVDGLTIQRMTSSLGVTKGSFYHHFPGIDAYHGDLVNYWAEQYLTTSDDPPDLPQERLALLDRIMSEAFSRVTRPEAAMRAWAHRDPAVQAVVAGVEAARKRFVHHVFSSLAASRKDAQLMTEMFAAMLVGCITQLPPVSRKEVLVLYEEFKRLYGLDSPP